jgi:hypothetical protein
MQREIIIRIKPASPALEGQLVNTLKREYVITDTIKQRLGTESYIFLKVESKDAHP